MIFTKSSGLNDSIFGKSQEPIKLMLEQQEEAFEKNSIIGHVFFEDETTNFAEKYTYETSLQDFEAVGEGGAYPRSNMQEGFSKVIEPEEWKNSFEVTQTMIEDAKMGKVKQKSNQFMQSFGRTRELFATGILNNGQNAAFTFGRNNKRFDISCADGKPVFAVDHPSKTGRGVTQSNYFGNAFSYDALCLAEEAMHYFRDDDGNILNLQPDTIIIPDRARIKKLVFDAIGAEGIPGTANNSFNFQHGRWNVIISPYLANTPGITAGTDSWYLLDSTYNEAYAGLVWLKRLELSVRSYVDENTDNNIFKGRARYGAAPNNWRAICKVDPGLGTVLG
jgi:phage major head subunit gpT-like protein